MQLLNVTPFTLIQLEKLSHRLPNHRMVNYDSLKDQNQEVDENYVFAMSTWVIILITVLGTLMIATGIAAYFHCKYR